MILSISLFDNDLMRIVSITFTSLILNELLLVAVKITNWHIYMIYAQVLSLFLYIIALRILKTYFGKYFLLISRFEFCFHDQFSMESITYHLCQLTSLFPD
jgi:phospholipid-translocating ATPase